MNGSPARRGLQAFLSLLGGAALVLGGLSMVLGASFVLDAGTFTPSVDSEIRFYASWYAAAGAIVLWSVPRIETATATIRIVGAVFFFAACARILSLIVVGGPHPFFIVLIVVELLIPIVAVPWQAAVARRAEVGSVRS